MSQLIACETCGAGIAATAKTCPACGAPNKYRKPISVVTLAVAAVIVIAVVVAIEGRTSEREAERQRCIEWGVAYFKEIGSYPTLSDGRNAAEVARERCDRTLDAFPDPGRPDPGRPE